MTTREILHLKEEEEEFYNEEMIKHFRPLSEPGPSDWLSSHHEEGQTYTDYLQLGGNEITPQRNVIYLLPLQLDDIPDDNFDNFDNFDEFEILKELSIALNLFYQLEVKIHSKLHITNQIVRTRTNCLKLQLNTTDILALMTKCLPKDAYCMLSFTHIDLYPNDSYNYVFGQASLTGRVGLFSFARYDPSFFGHSRLTKDERKILLRERCLKVMLHETGHMFGMHHCIYYSCLLNGSNNLIETDRRYPFLCPVCLRKIQYRLKLTTSQLLERYKLFYDFLVDFLGELHPYTLWLRDHISLCKH